jgi:hypothetical protein
MSEKGMEMIFVPNIIVVGESGQKERLAKTPRAKEHENIPSLFTTRDKCCTIEVNVF